MSYSTKLLFEKLKAFKNTYGRYPTRRDFILKKIIPSKNVFYRVFGNMKNAVNQYELYEKGELEFEEEKKTQRVVSKKGKFKCHFCGSENQKPFDFTTCATLIRSRLVDLLKNSKNADYSDAIFDCLLNIFGKNHKEVKNLLIQEGFYSDYVKRINEAGADLKA